MSTITGMSDSNGITPMEVRVIISVCGNQDIINISFLTLSSLSYKFPSVEFTIEYIDSVVFSIVSRACPGSVIWSSTSYTHVSIMSTSISYTNNFEQTGLSCMRVEFNIKADFEVIFRNISIRSSMIPYEIRMRRMLCQSKVTWFDFLHATMVVNIVTRHTNSSFECHSLQFFPVIIQGDPRIFKRTFSSVPFSSVSFFRNGTSQDISVFI
jgi:hypothetical protein